MELELKKECLDTYELGEPQTLTQEETAELRSMQGMYRQLRQVREETP